MSGHAPARFRPEPGNPVEHPASLAWLTLDSRRPSDVEALRSGRGAFSKKSEIYWLKLDDAEIIAKRSRLASLETESRIYSEVLPLIPVPSVGYYGLVLDSDTGRAWIFLDAVKGALFSPTIPLHRAVASEWAATLHTSTTGLGLSDFLPPVGPSRYLRYLDRSITLITDGLSNGNPSLSRTDIRELDSLVATLIKVRERWADIEAKCRIYPSCVVHGDLIGKNARVVEGETDARLYPFDWEASGWGLPAEDLAGLDPAIYHQHAREVWPHLKRDDIDLLAIIGLMFQSIALIWPTSAGLTHDWLGTTVADLIGYHNLLTSTSQIVGWL